MEYKDRQLQTGSDYYAAGMELMAHEEDPRCVRGAVELFVCGAELHDRFCISRLKEVVRTPQYLDALGSFECSDLIQALAVALQGEIAEREMRDLIARQKSGLFGTMKPKPINGQAVRDISPERARASGMGCGN